MTTNRLVSLDAFRGFTVAAMVLVNNPGSWSHIHPPLAHAKWNGWTFTDTIFPLFLFICGVSMALSLDRRSRAGDDRRAQIRALVRRGAIIFLIGLALNFIPAFDVSTVRIPGVLQRIGLCVALAAPIVVLYGWRGQSVAILKVFALYAVVMLLVPVPDVSGRVVLGAGTLLDAVLMPINKSLWSVSYSVFMTGWALLGFGAFYWIIDGNESAWLRDRSSIAVLPFTIYGLNALFVFAFSGLVARLLSIADLKHSMYAPFQSLPISPENASLAFAVSFNLVMFAVAWAMWKKGWFIKV